MNFKEHFEKFEADIRKKMRDDELIQQSLIEVATNYKDLKNRFETLIDSVENLRKTPDDPFFSNDEFMKIMKISTRTAQLWRDKEIIGYSQVQGKIYYRLSDIQKLLDYNHHKANTKIKEQ